MSLRASTLFVRASAASLILCGLAGVASAQNASPSAPTTTSAQQSSQPPTTTTDKPTPEEADLSITARVTAAEVLFRKVPNPKVEFTGQPERRTLWESERENIPDEVQPGVTYRNVGITLRIVSVFADIDRIVAEALGETPVSDDTPPANTAPPSQVTPPATPTSPAAEAPSDNPRRAARRANQNDRRTRTARTPR